MTAAFETSAADFVDPAAGGPGDRPDLDLTVLGDDATPTDGDGRGDTRSWLDSLTDEDADSEDSTSMSLFEGDTGGLTLPQRRTLVTLLKHRFITASKQPTEWRALLEAEQQLRSRLNDLFLDLHIDRQRQVAFKRQATPEASGRFPTLLHDNSWTREETILLIFLRTRFRSERNDGADDVIVDREDLLGQVTAFRPAHATDVAGDNRKADNAADALKRAGILIKTNDEHRLLVSPVIEVLLPVDKLQQLLDWFIRQNNPIGAHPDVAPAETGEAGELRVDSDPSADVGTDDTDSPADMANMDSVDSEQIRPADDTTPHADEELAR